VHNGFVNVNGQKMSKSLGNFITIRKVMAWLLYYFLFQISIPCFLKYCQPFQVIELYHPLALRMFLLGTHYRAPINYTVEQLNVASDRLYYTYQVYSIVMASCYCYVLLLCSHELLTCLITGFAYTIAGGSLWMLG
jgi:cysteinyl-tRNA synthetase